MRAPSRKISVFILVAVVVVTAVISFSTYLDKKPESTDSLKIATGNLKIEIQNDSSDQSDKDGDGLLDWEEVLWSTDPNNPDTDGDGTNDNDEISANRNPRVAGPDDTNQDPIESILSELEKNPVDSDNLTSQLSLEFVNDYLKLRSQGSVSSSDKDALIKSFVTKSTNSVYVGDVYNVSMLTTFGSNNKEKVLNYLNTLFTRLAEIEEAQNDPQYAGNDQEAIILAYNFSEELMLMETPVELTSFQVDLANSYYKIGKLSEIIVLENNDAVRVLSAFNQLQEVLSNNESVAYDINDYVVENGIILENDGFKFE